MTKRFLDTHGIKTTWVFTESGHGKGPMDGVGAAIKNAIDDAVIASESMGSVVVRSAEDLMPLLNLVNVEISKYSAEDIELMNSSAPDFSSLSIICKKIWDFKSS